MVRSIAPMATAAFAAVSLAAAPALPDRASLDPAPAGPTAGTLLMASAAIQDPRFQHSVILLLRHDAKGAFGVMINRPLRQRRIADLLAATGDHDSEDMKLDGSIRVFFGGPVQPQLGFLIHTADYHRRETLDVDGTIAMTASREALRDLAQQHGPKKSLFAFGYAGWGAGQLEDEIARRDWFTTPDDPTLVFDEDRGALWQHALERRTQEL